ncbi:MAG: proline dehydrogenase family protein [Longimicrobiales bacterium]
MLRDGLLFLSENRLARRFATEAPFAQGFSRRFVAGDTVADATRVARELNATGMKVSLDYLGEAVETRAEAEAARDVVLELLDRIAADRLDANISIKLTQLGQDIDGCFVHDNTSAILERARRHGLFIRFDMEGSEYTQRTLDFFGRVWAEGFTNCGVVIQSYLRRSVDDIRELNARGARVRLCKGAYKEPPELAFPDKRDVDANFVRLMEMLLEHGDYPGIATHDPAMIDATKRFGEKQGYDRDRFEFQMLYGVRRDLQNALVGEGYNMRVYVPFGEAWYPYFMRRMAERPSNLFFVLGSVVREAIG